MHQFVSLMCHCVAEQVSTVIKPSFRKINLEATDRVESCKAGMESETKEILGIVTGSVNESLSAGSGNDGLWDT